MRFLYSSGIAFYHLFIRIAAPFNAKARWWHYGRKDLFEKIDEVFAAHHAQESPAPVAWFHCASLGEYEQGKPVIEAFKSEFPDYLILLTFFSPSGYNQRHQIKDADHIFYLPIDSRQNAKRFVKTVKPAVAVFVKYEFWFNFLNELFIRNIPVFTISAIFRPTQHFFRWYGGWSRTHLRKINRIFVQDEESAELMRMIDVGNIVVSGDTRFDRVSDVKAIQKPFPLIDRFVGGKQIVVAGSTWPADENLLMALSKETGGKLKFIIAPHEIHETRIKELARKLGPQAAIYSKSANASLIDKTFLIVDSMGMLSQLYRFANIAYVGGGFGAGIHNILEAAAYGVPVFFGPNYYRFREAREMTKGEMAFPVTNSEELSTQVNALLNDREKLELTSAKAGKYVQEHAGATRIIMEGIAPVLKAGK